MPNPELMPADFTTSVVAVPPIALDTELRVEPDANVRLVRHIEQGGVNILLYGGNANLYHYDLARFADALAMMTASAAPGTRVIASIGPDHGKIVDQAPLVERAGLRNVMLLPVGFPSASAGVARGVKLAAGRLGFGVVLYLKRDMYLAPDAVERLVAEGAVRFIKYAVERDDPSKDAYLDAVISAVGRDRVASGMGETPIGDHIGRRGLATFTSGAVCIAPRAAMSLLWLYRSGRIAEADAAAQPFLAFERVRSQLGGIQVLHDAVGIAGIAPMGPLMPMLSNAERPAARGGDGGLAGSSPPRPQQRPDGICDQGNPAPSAAKRRHGAGDAAYSAVGDGEIVSARLAHYRRCDDGHERLAAGGAQGRAQIHPAFVAEAGVEPAGGADPHPVAAGAEIAGERRDEAEAAARLGDAHVARRAARTVGEGRASSAARGRRAGRRAADASLRGKARDAERHLLDQREVHALRMGEPDQLVHLAPERPRMATALSPPGAPLTARPRFRPAPADVAEPRDLPVALDRAYRARR